MANPSGTAAPLGQAQPPQRPGETLTAFGRWNNKALADLRAAASDTSPIAWTKGTLGHIATIGPLVVGNVHRYRREQPWLVVLTGFEWWTAPTRIIPRWHYTPPKAVEGLRLAKKSLLDVVSVSLIVEPGFDELASPEIFSPTDEDPQPA